MTGKNKGFTLIDLLFIIALLAIVTAIILPSIAHAIAHNSQAEQSNYIVHTVYGPDQYIMSYEPVEDENAIKVVLIDSTVLIIPWTNISSIEQLEKKRKKHEPIKRDWEE